MPLAPLARAIPAAVPAKLLKSTPEPVVVSAPPIARVLPATTFHAWLPFKVSAQLNVTFRLAALMSMPGQPENPELSNVSVLPAAIFTAPFMLLANTNPPSVTLPPKASAPSLPEEMVLSNRPMEVLLGSELGIQSLIPFIVAVSAFMITPADCGTLNKSATELVMLPAPLLATMKKSDHAVGVVVW